MKIKPATATIKPIPVCPEPAPKIRPPKTIHCEKFEVRLTIGTNLERIVSHSYAFACCTACPHSWAATAAEAAFLWLKTDSLKFTVLSAGL